MGICTFLLFKIYDNVNRFRAHIPECGQCIGNPQCRIMQRVYCPMLIAPCRQSKKSHATLSAAVMQMSEYSTRPCRHPSTATMYLDLNVQHLIHKPMHPPVGHSCIPWANDYDALDGAPKMRALPNGALSRKRALTLCPTKSPMPSMGMRSPRVPIDTGTAPDVMPSQIIACTSATHAHTPAQDVSQCTNATGRDDK